MDFTRDGFALVLPYASQMRRQLAQLLAGVPELLLGTLLRRDVGHDAIPEHHAGGQRTRAGCNFDPRRGDAFTRRYASCPIEILERGRGVTGQRLQPRRSAAREQLEESP